MAAAMGEIEDKLAELRQTFRSGITKSGAWRKNQLRALIELLQDNEDKIFKALHQDLGKHPVETYRDEASLLIIIINIYWYYSFLMYHNFNLRFFLLITLMQIGLIKKSAKYALSCLDKWMAPKKVSVTNFILFSFLISSGCRCNCTTPSSETEMILTEPWLGGARNVLRSNNNNNIFVFFFLGSVACLCCSSLRVEKWCLSHSV